MNFFPKLRIANYALRIPPSFTFAIVTLLAYGLLLPFTGFYWDDLPFAWIAQFLGPREFIPAFAPFRPFLGPIFYLTTTLVPPVPLYWQIFALVIRFITGIAAWWTFKQIWRAHPYRAYVAALILTVFPGYSQHWVAFTHINQEFVSFIFYILSFGFTFKALQTRKPAHTIIALLLQVCGIFPTEYFFGIEGLRFLFLFFHVGRIGNPTDYTTINKEAESRVGNPTYTQKFIRAFKTWFPYLLVWMLNAAWLIYYYKFGAYASYQVTAARTFTAYDYLWEALDALLKTGFYVWIQVLPLTFSSLPAPASLLTLGLIAISLIVIFPQIKQNFQSQDDTLDSANAPALIIIGVIGILLGRLPSLAAGLPLTLQSSYDRFMVSMMIGGTVFIIGLVELLFKNKTIQIAVFTALVALGIGQQFFNANIFRRDWEKQKEIYWQMAWRIPALKPNTVILTHQMPIDYETDMSFTAPINWMYAPEFKGGDLPYLMLYTEKRIGGSTLASFEPNTPITFPYRTSIFYGNTSQAIVIYMPKNGCLRVLDPKRGDEAIYAKLPKVLTDAIPLSDTANIIAETNTPATAKMFFSEPRHEWCYYLAKAELAQQLNDYEKVVALGDEATSLGYTPQDQNEWLIFIEAYVFTGDLDQAEKLSTNALKEDARIKRGVCTVWERVKNTHAAESDQTLKKFGCGN
jgi:hypothetical protein